MWFGAIHLSKNWRLEAKALVLQLDNHVHYLPPRLQEGEFQTEKIFCSSSSSYTAGHITKFGGICFKTTWLSPQLGKPFHILLVFL
jgi:hypothetical protein